MGRAVNELTVDNCAWEKVKTEDGEHEPLHFPEPIRPWLVKNGSLLSTKNVSPEPESRTSDVTNEKAEKELAVPSSVPSKEKLAELELAVENAPKINENDSISVSSTRPFAVIAALSKVIVPLIESRSDKPYKEQLTKQAL